MTICKIDSQWQIAYDAGSSDLVLSDSLEGWDGVKGGRKVQEGGDISIPGVESC